MDVANKERVIQVRLIHKALTSRQKKALLIILGVIFLIVIGWCAYKLATSSSMYVDGGKYQAVFTTNNQAYFGKLQQLSDGSYRLTNVYYLQQQGSTAQKPNSGNQTPQLVKMGSELHGPEDAIIFPSEQVQFWENLKSDSKVTKAINDYNKK